MSGLDNLSALANGTRPADDGLIGNTRFVWGTNELLGEEAILAEFSARPFNLGEELFSVETPQAAAFIGSSGALFADLYGGRIGRLWRIGAGIAPSSEPAIDVAFDADMRQERGDLSFRAEDHPNLDSSAAEGLLSAGRDIIDGLRGEGKLRVRGYVIRAFGDTQASAALLSLFTLSNGTRRSASFSYAAIGVRSDGKVIAACDPIEPREWTPRF